ncbi:hypothetical protein A4U61_08385 [Streptomyces sp. H-KF8]|nr:hypothetical protein A4U61_08385 [Streptomyces sp. H-KF8]
MRLPLAGVFQGPTVREIAVLVDRAGDAGGTTPGRHVMTRLGRSEHREKLFLFPPIAGWGLVYLPLAELLPGSRCTPSTSSRRSTASASTRT